MRNDLKNEDRVQLISFNGSLEPDTNTTPNENYWQLIQQNGTIVRDPSQKDLLKVIGGGQRVLVQFDINVQSLGLECHNRIENSLWIMVEDLKKIIM